MSARTFAVWGLCGLLAGGSVVAAWQAGAFETVANWLAAAYQQERLLPNQGLRPHGLTMTAILASGLGGAWLSAEAKRTRTAWWGIVAVGVLWCFTSATLAPYGVFFEPFSALAAVLLGAVSAWFTVEPQEMWSEKLQRWTKGRVSAQTLEKLGRDEEIARLAPREVWLLEVSNNNFAVGQLLTAEMAQHQQKVWDEVADTLRQCDGCLLDLPQSERVKAYFIAWPEGEVSEPAEENLSATVDEAVAKVRQALKTLNQLRQDSNQAPCEAKISTARGSAIVGLHMVRSEEQLAVSCFVPEGK